MSQSKSQSKQKSGDTIPQKQIEGVDHDAVESQLYKGEVSDYCALCKRSLKSKTMCINPKGGYRCFDEVQEKSFAVEAFVCNLIVYIERNLPSGRYLTDTLKTKLGRIIKELQ